MVASVANPYIRHSRIPNGSNAQPELGLVSLNWVWSRAGRGLGGAETGLRDTNEGGDAHEPLDWVWSVPRGVGGHWKDGLSGQSVCRRGQRGWTGSGQNTGGNGLDGFVHKGIEIAGGINHA